MGISTLIHNPSARRILITYVASLVAIALLVSCGNGDGVATIAFGASGLAACVGCLYLVLQLTQLVVWQRRVEALNELTDGLSLTAASGSSKADFGWNRLVEQGKRWCALEQLERSIHGQLNKSSGSSTLQLLDALPAGVAAVDRTGTITYANAVLAAMCDRDSPAQMLRQPLASELGVDQEAVARINNPSGIQQSIVEWSVTAGSTTRKLRGERRPVDTGDGQTCFVWTVRDVSQQRLAESMREEFLAAATHEFRTPLANIRAYSESLDISDEYDAESRKRFYNVIQSESVRLSQLVDDLLDISRMQAGGLILESRETDLGRLVEEVSHKIQGEMQEKHLQYRVELPPKFPKVSVDKGKLSAALVNLLGNAVKYTPEGGCVTFRVDLSGDSIQFSISDTGIGISPDELPKVFDRFYRSHDERVREISGSGLGLALAQEIARLHGGDIEVESRLDAGTTFRLAIPVNSIAYAQEVASGTAI
ncbi:MAG: ATP-binding protein [Pirellulaceae bacterium]